MATKRKKTVKDKSTPTVPEFFKGPVQYHHLRPVTPLTHAQKVFCSSYDAGQEAFVLHGVAGTGKTYLALYKGLQEVLGSNGTKRLIIMRSAVPSREIGYLPGSEEEKMSAYLVPYMDICSKLCNHPQAWEKLVAQELVEFWSTSFIRGVTLDNAVIIIDEMQNMTDQELNSIMTRVGNHSKVLFCGDFRQTDLNKRHDQSGLADFLKTAAMMDEFKIIEFHIEDIVRSSLMKSYIIARLSLEDKK